MNYKSILFTLFLLLPLASVNVQAMESSTTSEFQVTEFTNQSLKENYKGWVKIGSRYYKQTQNGAFEPMSTEELKLEFPGMSITERTANNAAHHPYSVGNRLIGIVGCTKTTYDYLEGNDITNDVAGTLAGMAAYTGLTFLYRTLLQSQPTTTNVGPTSTDGRRTGSKQEATKKLTLPELIEADFNAALSNYQLRNEDAVRIQTSGYGHEAYKAVCSFYDALKRADATRDSKIAAKQQLDKILKKIFEPSSSTAQTAPVKPAVSAIYLSFINSANAVQKDLIAKFKHLSIRRDIKQLLDEVAQRTIRKDELEDEIPRREEAFVENNFEVLCKDQAEDENIMRLIGSFFDALKKRNKQEIQQALDAFCAATGMTNIDVPTMLPFGAHAVIGGAQIGAQLKLKPGFKPALKPTAKPAGKPASTSSSSGADSELAQKLEKRRSVNGETN